MAKVFFETITEMFENSLAEYSEKKIHFWCDLDREEELTYRELNCQAKKLAIELMKCGIKKDDKIMIQLPYPGMYARSFWGILYSGAVPIALPFSMSDVAGRDVLNKQLNICRNMGVLYIVIPESYKTEYEQAVAGFSNVILLIYEELLLNAKEHVLDSVKFPALDREDKCCILFSSGSTDYPKGVVLTQKTMTASILGALEIIDYTDEENSLSWLPMTHAFGFIGFHLLPIACGANQNIMPPSMFVKYPGWFIRQVSARRISIFGAMNFAMKLLMANVTEEDLGMLDLSSVKHLFLGAEPVNADLALQFVQYFAVAGLSENAMRPIYGLSESAFAISCAASHQYLRADCLDIHALADNRVVFVKEDDENSVKYVSVGLPIPDLEVLVADECGNALPDEQIGELCYAGECISERYYFEENETSKRMFGKFLASGDMGYISRGEIIITGRKKDIIFVNGQNYYPLDIENMISRAVSEYKDKIIALQAYNRRNEAELILFIEYQGELPEFVERIRELDLIVKKEQFLHFNYYLPVSAIPKTSSGKVKRSELLKRYLAGEFNQVICDISSYIQREEIVFEDDYSRQLQEIWNEVLQIDTADKSRNFFEAGGDSIKLLQLSTKIMEKTGVEVPLRELLQAFDVKTFVNIVKRCGNDTASPETISVEPEPDKVEEPFNLTDIQLAYLLGREQVYDMGGISTHGYYEYKVDYDMSRFEQALNKIIKNQDNLRLIITNDRKQKILKEVPWYHIETIDGTKMAAEQIEEVRARERQRMSHAIFQPEEWPLFEFKCLKCNEKGSYLFFGIDLMIIDASSIQMFKEMLIDCYENPDKELEKLTFSFRDFMHGIDIIKQTRKYEKDKAYWQSRIPMIPQSPQLPLKKSTTDIENSEFARLALDIPEARVDQLREMASKNGISLSSVVCTAYAMALSYYSNQPGCSLNITIFNKYRFHKDVDRMMGDFTSTILLPFHFEEGTTVSDVFKTIQNEILQGLEHRYYSGVEFLRDLKRSSNSGNSAIMPIVFTSTLDRFSGALGDLGELCYGISQTSQVYLDCQAREEKGSLIITWDYISELFDGAFMEDMFGLFKKILMTIKEDQCISSYFSPDSEYKEILRKYNDTAHEIPDKTLYGLFAESVADYGDRTAIKDEKGNYTYAELLKASDAVAAYLSSNGVKKGDRIAVMGYRQKETIANILGILKTGAAYVPIDPENPKLRQQDIVEDAGCRLILDGAVPVEEEFPVSESKADPDATGYIIYTSGSTGKPKGVIISNKAAANTIQDINQRYAVNKDECFIGLSSICFDLSVYDIFGSLSCGAKLIMVSDPRDIRSVADIVRKEEVTIWNSVPAFMQMYTEELQRESSKSFTELGNADMDVYDNVLRLIILSGDWIPVSLPDMIQKYIPGVELVSMGGATEASIWSIYYPVGNVSKDWKSIPYGMPLANQSFYVLGYHRQPCPVGVAGELYIGGKGLANGYLNRPELNQKAFLNHPEYGRLYKTGDYGVLRMNGNEVYIEFLGRNDSQVKIRGHRIELGEVEKALYQLNGVNEAAAILLNPDENTRMIAAFLTAGSRIDTEAAKTALADYLPHYMIPAVVIQIAEFPLTGNGKIDRQKLNDLVNMVEDDKRTVPRNDTELKIHAIWTEVLGMQEITYNENFYDIGGDSIKLFSIIDRTEEQFGIHISKEKYFAFETIAELEEIVTGLLHGIK